MVRSEEKKTLVRAEIVDSVSQGTGLTKVDVDAVMDGMEAMVTQALADGRRVELRGFGTFATRRRSARQGRNPATGEPVTIAEKTIPTFKPSKHLKDAVQETSKR